MVLCFVKHDNGSTAAEMDEQLVLDLATWELKPSYFMVLVTDSARNTNCLGRLLETWCAPLIVCTINSVHH